MRLTWVGVRRPALRIALAAASVALVSGCQGGGGASASGSVTVAVVAGIDSAPLSAGVNAGTFQHSGLHVTVHDYPSVSAELQALSSGQAQFAVGDYTGFFQAQAAGKISLRLIADAYDTAAGSVAILTLPGSGITTQQDLEDLAGGVATPAAVVSFSQTEPYNFETLAAEEVLQSDGVSPSSVPWQPMQPGQMITSLRTGKVKAILATEPYILEAEEQLGAVEVIDASSGVASDLPLSGYFSLASYAKANASTVQAFQDALSQAQSNAAQRGTVQSVLPQLTGMTKDDASLVTLGTYPSSLDVGQVQRVATLMYDSGMIASPLTVSTLSSG